MNLSELFVQDVEAAEDGEEFYKFSCGNHLFNVGMSTEEEPKWYGEIYSPDYANPAFVDVGPFDTPKEAMNALEVEFEPLLKKYHDLYVQLNAAPS